jgi:hypothetical protein
MECLFFLHDFRQPVEDQEARGVDPDQRERGEGGDERDGAPHRPGDRAEDCGEGQELPYQVPGEGECPQQVILLCIMSLVCNANTEVVI